MRLRKRETYHHGNLREALVETALQLLAERGIEGFTLRECARRLGVSATSAAHHFGDVNGLFAAVALRGFRSLTESLHKDVVASEARGTDPRTRLQEVCEGYLVFAHDNPDLYRITFGKLIRRDDPELAEASHTAFRAFAAQVAKARRTPSGQPSDCDSPEIGRLAMIAWATLHGLATLAIDGRLGFVLRGQAVHGLDTFETEMVATLTALIAEGGKVPTVLDLAGARS